MGLLLSSWFQQMQLEVSVVQKISNTHHSPKKAISNLVEDLFRCFMRLSITCASVCSFPMLIA